MSDQSQSRTPHGRKKGGLLQRLCPHWWTADPGMLTDTVALDIHESEKCMICGMRRWTVSIKDGFEPHPSKTFDVPEELAQPGLIVEVADRD